MSSPRSGKSRTAPAPAGPLRLPQAPPSRPLLIHRFAKSRIPATSQRILAIMTCENSQGAVVPDPPFERQSPAHGDAGIRMPPTAVRHGKFEMTTRVKWNNSSKWHARGRWRACLPFADARKPWPPPAAAMPHVGPSDFVHGGTECGRPFWPSVDSRFSRGGLNSTSYAACKASRMFARCRASLHRAQSSGTSHGVAVLEMGACRTVPPANRELPLAAGAISEVELMVARFRIATYFLLATAASLLLVWALSLGGPKAIFLDVEQSGLTPLRGDWHLDAEYRRFLLGDGPAPAALQRGGYCVMLDAGNLVVRYYNMGSGTVAVPAMFGPPGARVGTDSIRFPLLLPSLLLIAAGASCGLAIKSIAHQRAKNGLCEYCGYDLQGGEPTSKCPECGRSKRGISE